MDARRAQDILKHICQDADYGQEFMNKIPLSDVVGMVNKILPACVNEAKKKGNGNDEGFFNEMIDKYRPMAIRKILESERMFVGYCELTGYPYMVDDRMVVMYDYAETSKIEGILGLAGYGVTFGRVDKESFRAEVGHMYRNGYNKIMFLDGKNSAFIVDREELYPYEAFFNDEYITNPGLQSAMIGFFQESRKVTPGDEARDAIIAKREQTLLSQIYNAEFMVPCVKEETEEEVSISHPFVDLTDRVENKEEGQQIIAIPVFTDGYEMDKCYTGQHENMLYKFVELCELIEELDASGIIINCLGMSYYLSKTACGAVLAGSGDLN